ncbi:Bug family tripartite tricarboxylate transporter substrate binding protein [Verminephrobacter eiseniae]|uniref:Bug family tripartite tricarboxylate transporter substrate binding protein n=1 Tax=Verminephrobacter eiseniae TaxID=364317 RepID=UPI002237CFDF|nr:tripartite tricarboxylate transporter substrate binding protein [Verminephrobacter eiseniae]MCW5229820.1 tripartite tricarboxylate transporter substrate binding protein [Verminephrobacter eiseniae]MCW5291551.1 tripartite tricarboxylate transporter substrate binding protein [Verminephrobacter eiseniae]MCW8186172.1 tripartite tricarboxylate transporter substrate binding protein [Verminephrobacter eiseniae]MCW8222882.1 tripartite tricarboxylate transporter substrate binding protein [Verminephro
MKKNLNGLDHGDHFDRLDGGRRRLLALAAAGPLLGWSAGAGAQAGAHLPGIIKLVVGYSAGGPVDGCARLLAPTLAAELGTQVIVENRPGASGSLGGDAVAKAPPDGAMIYFGASPTITINPNIQRKMSFDPGKDLLPIAPLLTYTNVLVVNPELPVRNVGELLAYARANPGKLFYGSAGIGASNHMSAALLERMTGAPLSHVPYKGNAPAMSDVMAGNIAMMFDIVASARAYITSGKVRALAVTSRQRNRMLPDVPTMIESGVADYDVGGWYGLYGPAGMDKALAARITAAVRKLLAREDVAARLLDQGYDVWAGTAETLAAKGQADRKLWALAAKGIEAD